MGQQREEWKTWGDVFDQSTEETIQRMISGGYLDGLIGPLKVGKEANVFVGQKGEEHVIVKIYRTNTCDFNRMYDYMRGDPRLHSLSNQRRRIVFAWTQREYKNLLLAHKAGLRVPVPHACRNNVLVMDVIGKENPAQQLKARAPKDPKKFMKQVLKMMRQLHKSRIVHGDLSEYNILNDDDEPVFIDMSQSTTYENPNWRRYLDRDEYNIAAYFKKQGIAIDAAGVKEAVES